MTVYSTPALAYLDPGTGSIILQLLLGGLAGALVILKLYWFRLKALFSRKPADDRRSKDPESS
ncbi:MAG: hypothetical protein VX700_13995 [Pseudomonadota bacterium]|nr:hypothetical protein [Pseudomonadota bacterium]